MTGLLVAGFAAIAAGVAAIVFGIPVKEFSFGNTLILTGTIGTCTGLLLVGMALVVREMRRLAAGMRANATVAASGEGAIAAPLPVKRVASAEPRADITAAPEPAGKMSAAATPPWQEELERGKERERSRAAAAQPPEAPESADMPPGPVRRNLLFATSKRERPSDRLTERPADITAPDSGKRPPSVLTGGDVTSFVESWPSERAAAERPSRAAAPATRPTAPAPKPGVPAPKPAAPEPAAAKPEPEPEAEETEEAPVTVLKSGVVDGMAYSLYSDGSIEAQLPEGTMRFASIDDLREHLDRRGT